MAFHYLQLTFIKTPIFQYFDPECHIWIETDVSSDAIDDMLSWLASETRLYGIISKTNLS